MEFRDLQAAAIRVQEKYREFNAKQGHGPWGVAEYMQGFVGDVGDLAKLIMAKNGLRTKSDVDAKLAHELADCLWSIFAIARELEIDLEQVFMQTMTELEEKIDRGTK